ncbi:hypothetical protein ACFQGE_11640 [Halomicroarcula sp. GCM10025817]|uniref:hypothetical protein n=1 Tax=Haloarcula TaxID=2237 RepID=UPI0023E78159|nr:hypothetical protein [Halomicroarcula sp. SYNS111]
MSSLDEQRAETMTRDGTETTEAAETEELRRLRTENERLRSEYARVKQVQHKRTALGLLGVGLVCVAAGLVFPAERTVLIALGSTGVFGAVLTVFLSTEPVVPTTVGWSLANAVGANGASIKDELGLSDVAVYVPVEWGTASHEGPVRLFVPQCTEYDLPSDDALKTTFVSATEDSSRGVSFVPTSARLLREFDRSAAPVETTAALAEQLCDALVEQFELAESAEAEIDHETNRVSTALNGCTYPDATAFDHPAASFLGGGFAMQLDQSVTVDVERVDDKDVDVLVTCWWDQSTLNPE